MNYLAIKRFLKDAGVHNEDLKENTKDSAYSLRIRKQPKQTLQQVQIQPYIPKMQTNSKIMGYAQPVYDSKSFRSDFFTFSKSKGKDTEWSTKNIQMLQTIYKIVQKEGGIVQLLSKGFWETATLEIRRIRQQNRSFTDQQILKIYLDHLIEFQFASVGTPLNLKKGLRIHRTLKQGIFIAQSNKAFLQSVQIQKDFLDQEIVVIRNAAKTLNMENVTLERINQECGHESVQLRIQNPLDFGFNSFKLTNKDDKMTIKEYCEYQKYFEDEGYCKDKFGDKLKGGKVFFAVNFQPASGTIINDIKQKLKSTLFGWSQPHDMLSYLEQHINGCTNPQLYLKVRGVWTGGHQQNVNMCAININHGPAESEWYTVAGEQVQRLRKILKEKFKQDLYQHEGLWFQKINWFIENGIQITRIIQKAGDMVISGPGTLHWVRGYGVSMHSAWNIFPQSYKMLASAYHRQQQNLKIKFRKSNIIPLKTLTIKHIQHNYQNLSKDEKHILLVHLSKWFSEQQTQVQSIKLHNQRLLKIEYNKLQEHESYCKLCHQEILIYYLQIQHKNEILCLKCSLQGQLLKTSYQIYYKNDPKQFFTFISQAATNRLVIKELKYCSGQHIGKQCIKSKSIKLPNSETPKVVKLEDKGIQTQQLKRDYNQPFYAQEEKSNPSKRFHKDQKKLQEQEKQKKQRLKDQDIKASKSKQHSEGRSYSSYNQSTYTKRDNKRQHQEKQNFQSYKNRNQKTSYDERNDQNGEYYRKKSIWKQDKPYYHSNDNPEHSYWNQSYNNRNSQDNYRRNQTSHNEYANGSYRKQWNNNRYNNQGGYESSQNNYNNYRYNKNCNNRFDNCGSNRQNGDKTYQRYNQYQNGYNSNTYNDNRRRNNYYQNHENSKYQNGQKWQRKDYQKEEGQKQSQMKVQRKGSASEISY